MDETGKPMRFDAHTTRKIKVKEQFESSERLLSEEAKRFFTTLPEIDVRRKSGRGAKNEEIAKRQSKNNQALLLFHSMDFLIGSLIGSSNSEMLSWPNKQSPPSHFAPFRQSQRVVRSFGRTSERR
jgi:hypothetical protein